MAKLWRGKTLGCPPKKLESKTPQKNWNPKGWPPYYHLDAAPSTYEIQSDIVNLEGEASSNAGAKFDRAVQLTENTVNLTYTMLNTSSSKVDWGIWSVVQLIQRGMTVIPTPTDNKMWSSGNPEGLPVDHDWTIKEKYTFIENTSENAGEKIFSISSAGWSTYATDEQVLCLTYTSDPDAVYPEEEGSTEIYFGQEYIEVEHVGPLEELAPGEKTVLKEKQHLVKLPSFDSPEEKAEWIYNKGNTLKRLARC